jgi:hypothetical protein
VLALSARCAERQPDFAAALEANEPSARARGIDQFATWASAQAKDGEVGACERLVAR